MPVKNLTAQFVERVKPEGRRIDYFDDSMPGFSLRVSEQGVKSWCVSYRFNGKWKRFTLGRFPVIGLAEARKMASAILRDVTLGENPSAQKQEERKAPTFADLAAEFIQRTRVEPRSLREYTRIINKNLIPTFGTMKARAIQRRDIVAFLAHKAEKTPSEANHARAIMCRIYNWGIENDIVESNPVQHVRAPAKIGRRDRVLTEDEIKIVWRALESAPDGVATTRKRKIITAASLKFRLITAQRGGEVMNARWSEIDGDWWTIPKERAKNGLTHRVPMSPLALRVLDEVRTAVEGTGREKKPLSEFVFPSPRGNAPMSNPQKMVQRLRAATGSDFTGHDLRRTAASLMAGMGVPRIVISKILNHVESGVTAVYDRHSYDKEKREALDSWGRRLSVIVSDLHEVKLNT